MSLQIWNLEYVRDPCRYLLAHFCVLGELGPSWEEMS